MLQLAPPPRAAWHNSCVKSASIVRHASSSQAVSRSHSGAGSTPASVLPRRRTSASSSMPNRGHSVASTSSSPLSATAYRRFRVASAPADTPFVACLSEPGGARGRRNTTVERSRVTGGPARSSVVWRTSRQARRRGLPVSPPARAGALDPRVPSRRHARRADGAPVSRDRSAARRRLAVADVVAAAPRARPSAARASARRRRVGLRGPLRVDVEEGERQLRDGAWRSRSGGGRPRSRPRSRH